MIWWDFGG